MSVTGSVESLVALLREKLFAHYGERLTALETRGAMAKHGEMPFYDLDAIVVLKGEFNHLIELDETNQCVTQVIRAADRLVCVSMHFVTVAQYEKYLTEG